MYIWLAAVKLKPCLHVYIFKKRQDFHYIEIRDNNKHYVCLAGKAKSTNGF